MIRPAVLLLCLLAPPNAELERTDQMIESLTAMKAKLAAMQVDIDNMLRVLNEQRGSLQRAPQPFPYLSGTDSDSKEAVKSRCAALTTGGKRCTRPTEAGSRYCWQHQLAHTK
jgi:hypothetical protein